MNYSEQELKLQQLRKDRREAERGLQNVDKKLDKCFSDLKKLKKQLESLEGDTVKR